jgi:hypothetical protein
MLWNKVSRYTGGYTPLASWLAGGTMGTGVNTVEKFNFSSEILSLGANTLPTVRRQATGGSSATKGYFLNGITSTGTIHTSTATVTFANEATSDMSITIATNKYDAANANYRDSDCSYHLGGYTTTQVSSIGKLSHIPETHANIGAVLARARRNLGSSYNTIEVICFGGQSPTLVNDIDGMVFSSETATNTAAILSGPKMAMRGLSSDTVAYMCGGLLNTGSVWTNVIEKYVYTSVTSSVLGATLDASHGTGGVGLAESCGYSISGQDSGTTNGNTVNKLFYATETSSLTSATTAYPRRGIAFATQ